MMSVLFNVLVLFCNRILYISEKSNCLQVQDFTSDPQKIISDIEVIEEAPATSHCDLSLVFELIAHQISLPKCSSVSTVPPYIYRTSEFALINQHLAESFASAEFPAVITALASVVLS